MLDHHDSQYSQAHYSDVTVGSIGVSNHQPHDCLLSRLFRRRSKKISKLRVTGLCEGNSPGTGEFPAQMASNAENVSIWWRHYALFQRKPYVSCHLLTTLGPNQNNRHFVDGIFKCIFLHGKYFISFPRDPTGINPALDQAMSFIWTNEDPVHRCIYASFDINELNQYCNNKITNIPVVTTCTQIKSDLIYQYGQIPLNMWCDG